MSQLLLEWLNTSLVLNEHITSIREQFSNGYLYGEVLFKLHLITEPEFTTNFINSNEHDEIILNFSQLKSFLDLTLQLFLSEKQILQIMNRDISSAASLLYRIKTSNDQKKINFRNITTLNPINTKANEDEMKKKFLRLIDSECDATSSMLNNNRYNDDTCSIKDNSTTDIKRQSKIKHILQSTNLEIINDDNAVHHSNNNSIYDNNNNNNRDNTATTPMIKKVHVSRSQIISLPKTYNNINSGSVVNNSNSTVQFEVGVFNESLRRIGLDINIGKLNMLNGQLNFDMSQDVVMLKLKEQLRDRMTNKMKEHAMKSKRIRNELDIQQQQRKNIVPLNEINFLKRDKNPLLPRNDFNPYAKHNYKSQQFERRLNYENNYKQTKLQKTIQQRVNFFRSLILKPNNNNNKMDITTMKKDLFSKSSFFSALDKIPLHQSVLLSNQKLTRRNEDYPLIKTITYQIIDMAFEGYLYQLQYGEDLLELDEYKRWNKLFVNNLPLREASEDEETKRIKEANKVIETPVIDYNNIIEFNDNDNINFMNYVNYAGMWNERKVIDQQQHEQHDQSQYESTNDKIDYKDIVDNYDDTFEPTEEEMEDAVVQKVPCKNYLLSRLVEHVVDEKVKMESKDSVNNSNSVNNSSSSSSSVNKWNHIPFKMCVMGCPLVGKKTLVKEIKEKYKGIKVYSVMSIVDEHINEWNEINTPVESLAKYKTMKKPQIDAYIEEQKQKIEQFKDKYELIQPFISPTTTTSDNDSSKPSLSKDEALLQILITKIETDFPIQSEQDNISQIIQRQQTLAGLEDKLKLLIEQNTASKKPKTKDEQTIKKEIETIEASIYSGFILLDYPSTYNQCLLLEHYLTNYVDILSQPKQCKYIILDALANTIDMRVMKPITATTVQKGFDFVFALTCTPDDIERRYQSVKYDPQTKMVYSDTDISSGKVDKNIISRLQQYPRDVFDKCKSEYDNNYIAINNLYSSFGNIHEIQSTGNTTVQSVLEHIESKYLYPQYQIVLNKEKEIYNANSNTNNNNVNVNNTESQDVTRSIIATGTIHNNNNYGHSNTKHKTLSMMKMYIINTDSVISLYTLINTFNDKYISHSKHLLHLLTSQTSQIIERLELIQKKFNQFLNKPTKKKELLSLYKTKYNSFHKEHYALLSNPQVHEMFLTDIHSLNDQLWSFAQEKQFDSINELHTIQTSGYIENELYKLYITILELFNTESERYITSCDFIIQYFLNTNNNNNSNNNDIRSLRDIISSSKPKHQLHETPFPNKNSTASSLYKTNIHLTYLNMFNLLFKTNAYVKDVESKIISSTNINMSSQVNINMNESVIGQNKRKLRKKNSMLLGDSNVSHIFGGNGRIDDMKNGIRVEKRKMKIRAALIKAFAFKEIDKIVQVSNDVFRSMDEWIVQSVTKQNERINEVIYELECHLNEKTLIHTSSNDNEEHIVDPVDQIEFDDFSKEDNFYKWINVEDKFIYNTYDKVLPLFDYDVETLYKIIKKVKGYECAKNVLVKRVFDELVVKRYLCGRDDNDQHDDDNNNNNNNTHIHTHTHTHVLTDMNNTTAKQIVSGIPLAFQEMIDFSKYSKLYDLYKIEGDNKASDNSNDSNCSSSKEQFVNYSEVFTLICIAGLMVPSEDEVKEMVECSKKVIVNGHYMKKEDFLSMHLWYEPTIVIENSVNDDIKDNNNEQQQQQETKMSKQNSTSSIKDGNSNSNNKLSNQQSVASVQSKKLSKQKSTESIKGKSDSNNNSNTNTNNNKLSKQQSLTSVHDVKKEDDATNAGGGGGGGETSRKEIKEFIPSTIKELLFCIWKLEQPKEHNSNNTNTNSNSEELMNFTHFISVINPQRYVPLPDTYENYFDIVFPKQPSSLSQRSNNIINLNDSNSNHSNDLINN